MKNAIIFVLALLLMACASTGRYRALSHDESLEAEASRNDAIANSLEAAPGGKQGAEAFRAKARELRAAKTATPGVQEAAVEVGIDLLFQSLLGALDGASRSKPAR